MNESIVGWVSLFLVVVVVYSCRQMTGSAQFGAIVVASALLGVWAVTTFARGWLKRGGN